MQLTATLTTQGAVGLAVINSDIQNYLQPILVSLIGLAGIVATLFIVIGGIGYASSAGKPAKLEHSKKVLRNAVIGLVIVIAAGTLTAILTNAYSEGAQQTLSRVPELTPVETDTGGGGITEILINAIIGLFKHIIETAATPFISALEFFTKGTPLMAENPSVFRLWLVVLGIANSLFVAVVALLGFHVMSAASLGLDEIEFKHLLPKLGATFLLMNMSLIAIDAVISLSNAMINALSNAYSSLTVWEALSGVAEGAGGQGLVALLIMVVFLVLAVILLVYYLMRIVTLYVGAVLSPLIAMLQIVPGFRDFTITAVKTYMTTIFVLFVHIIILTLSASLFDGLRREGDLFDPVMSMLVGVATLVALLKTQGLMMQMTYVSAGPKALRKMGSQFINGVSYTASKYKSTRSARVAKGAK